MHISHYRDKGQVEVEFVVESGRQIVGIEVKAAASLKPEDFRALQRLKDATGNAFVCGVVLHDGERVRNVGEGQYAGALDEACSPLSAAPNRALGRAVLQIAQKS